MPVAMQNNQALNKTALARAMLVDRLLQDTTFGPEEIAAVTWAYKEALRILKPADSSESQRKRGERNPVRIRTLVLKQLGIPI